MRLRVFAHNNCVRVFALECVLNEQRKESRGGGEGGDSFHIFYGSFFQHYKDMQGGYATFVDSKLLNNRGAYGGAFAALGFGPIGLVSFTNCVLEGNSVTQDGGALYLLGVEVIMAHCVVHNNVASGRGGGVYLYTDPAHLALSDCNFTDNTALASGGR